MKKLAALTFAGACLTLQAQSQTFDPHQKLTLDIYRELIEINTVHPHGDNTAAARAMAKRLLDAGFDAKDVEVIAPHLRCRRGGMATSVLRSIQRQSSSVCTCERHH